MKRAKIDNFAQKIFLDRSPYYRDIEILYNICVKRNFRGYHLKNSQPIELLDEYKRIQSLNKPYLAELFYTYALSSQQIPLENRLQLVEHIDSVEIKYKDQKEAQRKLDRIITGTKHQTLEEYAKKYYNKRNKIEEDSQTYEEREEEMLLLPLKEERFEKLLNVQKLISVLDKKRREDEKYLEEFEEVCRTVGL